MRWRPTSLSCFWTTLKGSAYALIVAQTLTKLLIHIVFSTRNREPLISLEIEPDLFAYIGGICRGNDSVLLAAGGAADHVHLLVSASKNIPLTQLLQEIKRDSSAWMKRQPSVGSEFSWQDGYGAFSIGESHITAMRAYFAKQREHHRTESFQDEFRALLRKYSIEFDERYVWG